MLLREYKQCNRAKVVEEMLSEFGGVHTTLHSACGCKNVLHECRGSGQCLNIKTHCNSVQKFIRPIQPNVKEEIFSNCNIEIIYFRLCWQLSWKT